MVKADGMSSEAELMPDIDFKNIRAHNGSRHGGFEELSVQLFRSSITKNIAQITRVEGSGGDGGAEAFVALPDNSEMASRRSISIA